MRSFSAFSVSSSGMVFCFAIVHDLLDFDVGIEKDRLPKSGKRSMYGVRFSDLSFGNGLSRPFPSDKYAGIGEAARGAATCSERSDAKQPGLQSPGLLPRRARIQGLPLYRSAPFVPKGFIHLLESSLSC